MTKIVCRPKRVLVCGQRDYKNYQAVLDFLSLFPPRTVVIHGAAPGADRLADRAAKALGLTVEPYPAQWTTYGRAAGPIRNRRMLVEGQPDEAAAFYKKGGQHESKGTNNMVSILQKANVPVLIVEDVTVPPLKPPKRVIGL